MGITTEAGALLDNHPRLKNKALLLDIAIVNPCIGSNLGNAARHVGRPCYPFDSHSMPLVLVTNDTYYDNLWSDATKGAHSLLELLAEALSTLRFPPCVLYNTILFSRSFGLASTEPILCCLRFFLLAPGSSQFPTSRL